MIFAPPVEYAVAVDRYLAEADLAAASRRVYRISLTSWAWPLVGQLPPVGRDRRQASPPVVPLALLDRRDAGPKLAAALAHRAAHAQVRTVNRELSALRSAVGWWQRQRWILADPTEFLPPVAGEPAALAPLTGTQRAALFQAPAGLREHALWHLLQDTATSADAVLSLNAEGVDVAGRQARLCSGALLEFGAETADLIAWLLAGRAIPDLVFLTGRRAQAGLPGADTCPLTGRGRLSYRRAAEIFTYWSRPLDPAGRGWTLHQLRPPSRMLLSAGTCQASASQPGQQQAREGVNDLVIRVPGTPRAQ